jgi:ATP-dependent helicase HepA
VRHSPTRAAPSEAATLFGAPTVTFRATFARIEGCDHGVGKVIEERAGHCQIEFFKSPAGPNLHVVGVSADLVEPIELSVETRVFCQLDAGFWWAGRVQAGPISAQALGKSEDHYSVRFPNSREELIPISQLYVRWSHPIEDPTDYLAARVTDTPYFFDGRTRIVRHFAAQRAAFGGLSGLASSAIELLEHQVTTVRRVLADPIQRYLLADEVGLGKTIEAGVLIRQHVIDMGGRARVLVLAPEHLIGQWRDELTGKFFLDEQSGVNIAHEGELSNIPVERIKLTLLVVDEAHHSALSAFDTASEHRARYERLSKLAEQTPCVLLLSATPVLHQEDGFLAMLHLLDPQAYRLEDRAGFRRRIAERQGIADSVADLADDTSSFHLKGALEGIAHLRTEDPRLAELWEDAQARVNDDHVSHDRIQAVRRLRLHLVEIYRLHRRLLRTRREDRRVRDFLPARNGAHVITYSDAARNECADFLEAWRLEVATAGVGNPGCYERLFALWVESALSHPIALLEKVERRLTLGRQEASEDMCAESADVLSAPWAFAKEQQFLRERRVLLASSVAEEARAQCLVDWLRDHAEVAKVILFVSSPHIARSVAQHLSGQLGAGAVVVYEPDTTSIETFQQEADVRVLVCDSSAEEGLNLQRVSASIVHYDLPLVPARIEQRIGRVDRLEARGRLRNIVFSCESPYEAQWLSCLTDAIRVFHRSIAPLQYVLAEATTRLSTQLLADGASAFAAEAQRLTDSSSGLNAQLRRIKSQEGVDATQGDPEQDAAFYRELMEADQELEETGEQAMNAWVVDRLQFDRREVSRHAFRYVHDTRAPTLLPVMDTLRRFEHSIERNAGRRQLFSQIPLQASTFSRSGAERAHVGLMRVGHPVVTSLEALVRADDRGMAYAMWRQTPKFTQEPQLFIRFDFVIEADIRQALSTMGDEVSVQAIKRRADNAFPVLYHTVWLDRDLAEVRDEILLRVLHEPYNAEPIGGRRDTNVRRDRWEHVDCILGLDDWEGLCRRARSRAEQSIRGSAAFAERCRIYAERVRESAAQVAEVLESRCSRLKGAVREAEDRIASYEARLSEMLVMGIEAPTLRIDSAGAVILAHDPLMP